MKSVTTQKNKGISKSKKSVEKIILPFQDTEDDIDQLIREMQEEEMLARENEAYSLMAEIKKLNTIRLPKLPRVA
jgi:hypothetical protein